MADIFKSTGRMPPDPSPQVVRAQLAEPRNEYFAQVPGCCKWDHDIKHAPTPHVGKQV